jgi:dipeptidyl aminopeptidase/acylaminoacyl peptidase
MGWCQRGYAERVGRPFQAEDLYLLRTVTDCELHPHDTRTAYVVTWCDRETDSNRNQLWLHDGAVARPITYGHTASSPRFSPDGAWLAYLAGAHQTPPQLHVMSLAGGEPLLLVKLDDGCDDLAWLPDSSGLIITAKSRPEDQRGKTKEELAKAPRPRTIESTQFRFNGRGWINDRRTQLYAVALPTPGEAPAPPVQLTDGAFDSFGGKPSPDGQQIAFMSARHDDREWSGGNDVWLTGRDGSEPRRVTTNGSWQTLAWVDNTRLVAVGQRERGVVVLAAPHLIETSAPSAPQIIGDGETSTPGRLQVRGDALFALGVTRGATHIHRYDILTGERRSIIDGRRQVLAFGVSADATRLVFAATGSNTPAELFERSEQAERQLTTHTAPFLAEVELAEVEDVTVTSADGYEVHAFVCAPKDRTSPSPGLVYVHGGPLAHYGYGFFDEFQMAAAQGYVVIGANPRGSDGYGVAHANAIIGDLGKLDWLDIQATTHALAARPDVDAMRLGIGGGSYGGYMTAWATSHIDRFKAALVERAVINWVSMEATSDIGWFVTTTMKADTLTNIESLRRQSPITYVRNVRTPTLILHSDEDWRCPPEQAEQWHGALRRNGVDVSYVRFPGENHELTRTGRPSFRVERFGMVHNFYARYLEPDVT